MHTYETPDMSICVLDSERVVLVIGNNANEVNIFMNTESASELFAKMALAARDFDQQINEQGAK